MKHNSSRLVTSLGDEKLVRIRSELHCVDLIVLGEREARAQVGLEKTFLSLGWFVLGLLESGVDGLLSIHAVL